jgi:pyruvate formate lyase activating enzyme
MNNIIIGGIETFSTVDFPNNMSFVVFMQGCAWKCPYCHNKELQPCLQRTDLDWDEIKSFLYKRRNLLDAVVFSGGEPLLQDNLEFAVNEVKSFGYKVALHTGGVKPKLLAKIIDKIDWVGFDFKAPKEKYKIATGGLDSYKQVVESLDVILNSDTDYEIRMTLDPNFLEVEDVKKVAEYLIHKGVKEFHLQKYRPIKGDNTTDEECEKFFKDDEFIKYLEENFNIFSIRR